MAIYETEFSVRAPGHEGLVLALSLLVGVLKLRRDWRGHRYITMPAPFGHLQVFDGETFTPCKCREFAAALRYFTHDARVIDALTAAPQ